MTPYFDVTVWLREYEPQKWTVSFTIKQLHEGKEEVGNIYLPGFYGSRRAALMASIDVQKAMAEALEGGR